MTHRDVNSLSVNFVEEHYPSAPLSLFEKLMNGFYYI